MDNRFLFLEYLGKSDDKYFYFNSVKTINGVNKIKNEIKILKGNIFTIYNLSYMNFEKNKMYLSIDFNGVFYVFPLSNKESDINTVFLNDFIMKSLTGETILQINENMIKYKSKDIFVINDYDIYDGNGLPCVIRKKING